MNEKLEFLKRLKPKLSLIEKDSLYEQLLDAVASQTLLIDTIENLEETVFLTNDIAQTIYANQKAAVTLGVSLTKTRRFVWEQIADDSISRFLEHNLLKTKNKTVRDFKVITPRELILRLTVIPLEQNDKKIFALIFNDISSRRSKESEALILSKMESLVRLASGIAHEIGNPLNAITIHLEILKKRLSSLPSNKRQVLNESLMEIQDETRRLDKVIRNFLKATRKPPLRFRQDSLNEIIGEALSFMKPQLARGNIHSQVKYDESLPSFLMDKDRLYSVFINLIKNAEESMSGRDGTLKVQTARKNNCAVISITDTGCGIDKKNIDKIFDIYYTTKREGSGLGLMMVYDSIAEHGGKIEVKSKLQKGTTFKIILPIREPQLQLPHYQSSAEE